MSALPRHPVMNSRIQLLVTMAILRRRYRNRLMLLSSPFVLRIYSLPTLYFWTKTTTKGGTVNHSENQNKGCFINFVVILTQDKLQGYEWDINTRDLKIWSCKISIYFFFFMKKKVPMTHSSCFSSKTEPLCCLAISRQWWEQGSLPRLAVSPGNN